MSSADAFRSIRLKGDDARPWGEPIGKLYSKEFVDPPAINDPFYSFDRFMERWPEHLSLPKFELVLALTNDDVVAGFAYGNAVPSSEWWWGSLSNPLPEDFTREDGKRSFALIDYMVRKSLRGRGLGTRLHQEMISDRPEERICLFVGSDQVPAYPMYLKWGYEKVGEVQIYEDAPVLNALVLPLKAGTE